MNPISADVVEKTWVEMNQMHPEEMIRTVTELSEEQPDLLVYLMGAGDEIFNQDEREMFMYIGTAVWQMMSRGERPLVRVTEEDIFQAEDQNIQMLEQMAQESPGDFMAVTSRMLSEYNQIEILRYIVEAIMEEEEDLEIREDSRGWMLICLKSVVDCLDAD